PCRHVTDLLDTRLDVIDRQLAELAQLRTTIADLREDAAAGDPATCSPEDVCRYL
ncbi:heavy metal-responsive transcriptional regulator, partial [Micrococcus luteus]|nr:heavy metal-responsive transcriptional regulator [Micrococcus luteus]